MYSQPAADLYTTIFKGGASAPPFRSFSGYNKIALIAPMSTSKTHSVSNPLPLETDVPLSSSVIWQMQRDFYTRRGLKAWTEDMVPNFITNNPFIAEIYSKIVFAFLSEHGGACPEQPLRILEVGAGVGKFSYLFLRQFTNSLRHKNISPELVHYCMTDCSPELIQSWRSNSYLSEFVKSGILDFGLLQMGEQSNFPFLDRKGPLAVIANYVFDSVPQDAFIVKNGQVSEALVSTSSSPDSPAADFSRLRFSWTNVDVPPNRYADTSWNHILELYRSRLSGATIMFPCAALTFLKQVVERTEDPVLVLAADKGFTNEDALHFLQGQPQLEFHGGNCFSQMVNFDAIGKYFASIGGEALLPEKHFAPLNICAFIKDRGTNRFPLTAATYNDAQSGLGTDDLFTLLAWLNAHMEEMNVAQIVAALRLTRWDPIAFLRFFPILARQLRNVTVERMDLHDAVFHVWARYFPVKESENEIAFDCGVVLLELRFYDEAMAMFKESEKLLGRSARTSYNLGLCAAGLGRASGALDYMTEACNMDPQFEPATTMKRKLEEQIFQR